MPPKKRPAAPKSGGSKRPAPSKSPSKPPSKPPASKRASAAPGKKAPSRPSFGSASSVLSQLASAEDRDRLLSSVLSSGYLTSSLWPSLLKAKPDAKAAELFVELLHHAATSPYHTPSSVVAGGIFSFLRSPADHAAYASLFRAALAAPLPPHRRLWLLAATHRFSLSAAEFSPRLRECVGEAVGPDLLSLLPEPLLE
ncbi:hypothetical protein TeGR_g8947 [Tetraparma gracilis]|uniref:Uncharacterized protein n=1 Tax=Tetraparma gracilis TaxID=2962635 RepID=A0ABQ6MIK9_9STRA|nr:hypothetical protein TeGR_g8947 [Tetraparma gracilis]